MAAQVAAVTNQQALTIADIDAICASPHGLNLFASILLGDGFEQEFPETHQAYWALLTSAALNDDERELRYALGLPRGFAKTTLIKMFIVWLILFSKRKFFVLVSASLTLAQNGLSDVMDFLNLPKVQEIWGFWDRNVEKNTEDLKKFEFRGRNIILVALGAGSSTRGLNIKNERPEVVICDDAQTKECADSQTLNDAFVTWFLGTLYKARSYKRSLFVYIGNMYNDQCLLYKLKENPYWISLITSAILNDGTSIWPALRSVQSLIDEFNSDLSLGKGHIFLAEVMNDPQAGFQNGLDFTNLKPYPYPIDMKADAHFTTIDPALGKKSSDNTAIVDHGLIDGKLIVWDAVAEKLDDTKTVEEGLKLTLLHGGSLICVENAGYQATLAGYFQRTMVQRGITGIAIEPLSPKGIAKNDRIMNFLRKIISGEVLLHPRVAAKFLWKAVRFNPLKKDNDDDLLDAAAYGDPALQEFADQITYNAPQFDAEYESATVETGAQPLSF